MAATRSERDGGRWRRALLGCVLAWLALPTAAEPAAIVRTSASIELPTAASLLTPYVDAAGSTLLVHLQPRRGSGEEALVDARSGRRWPGDPAQVMATFARLGSETPREVAAGNAWDQQLLAALGCKAPLAFCTSPADADVVLLVRPPVAGQVALEVVDLRALFAAMDNLLAGRIASTDVSHDEAAWRLLELASRSAVRRARWLDALRSIDSRERWSRVVAAAEQGPRLAQWAALRSDGEGGIDLTGELERIGLRLHVQRLARSALAGGDAQATEALADGLLLANQAGFRGDMASALVDVLLQLDAADRTALSTRLASAAERRRSHGLLCYARWMLAEPCGRPPWEAQPPALTTTPPMLPRDAAVPDRPAAPAPSAAGVGVPSPPSALPRRVESATARPTSPASEAPLEWALIQTQPNQGVLLAYDETSGYLAPETGAAAGLAFVARTLGPLQEGRFELQVTPSSRAPLRLRHGAYRVKVRLVLDFAREDRCQAALTCLFSSAQRHARTERRDLVFTLDPGNQFVEKRRAEFGHLLPLAADGGQRYASTLTQARLSIEAVRFDLR